MTPEQEAALLAYGQQEADRQMLETLLTLDPLAREHFDYIKDHVYTDQTLVDFVQVWRDLYEWTAADYDALNY